MAMETQTSYGMLRKQVGSYGAAKEILLHIETEIAEVPFDFAVCECEERDGSSHLMDGLATALAYILNEKHGADVWNDENIMAAIMNAFWDKQ